MEAMQVLAHQTAMGYRASLSEALPDAPRLPHRPRARVGGRVRVRLAHSLRWTADRLDPACRPA
ncbi:hypothetical protein FH608_019570 [Nonomuraea phyllanthi]|uniref:Uncharacterized protein n=1 Tax=Nonomuraea phyllanthi TaxID=2219224 RepID=A0A5C4WEI5_9ACTN|nr:hypothetical protein [Nonomuraea phyllanthi]KAB8193443.1 hypothetical protein FH608_019570 [Nonomuraea phyllanthi]QFY12186.1 hypothetical protein GBF35_41455 [Nonomuraea phyllanthi]